MLEAFAAGFLASGSSNGNPARVKWPGMAINTTTAARRHAGIQKEYRIRLCVMILPIKATIFVGYSEKEVEPAHVRLENRANASKGGTACAASRRPAQSGAMIWAETFKSDRAGRPLKAGLFGRRATEPTTLISVTLLFLMRLRWFGEGWQ